MDWKPISDAPHEEIIWTKISDEGGDRNIQLLVRHGSLWFLPDRSLYVYYTPTHWHR